MLQLPGLAKLRSLNIGRGAISAPLFLVCRTTINSLREEQGTDALRERLGGMGKAVGRQVAARLAGVKDKRERIRALAGIMRELGYQSGSIDPAKERWPAIEATNCVFHNLAKCYPKVCHFDLAMMSEVVGCDTVHDECMVRGGHVCRFKFKELR